MIKKNSNISSPLEVKEAQKKSSPQLPPKAIDPPERLCHDLVGNSNEKN
jgi:hypothetical protein